MFSNFLNSFFSDDNNATDDVDSIKGYSCKNKLVRTSETTSSFQLNQGNDYLQNKSSIINRPKLNNNPNKQPNKHTWKGDDIIEGNSGMLGTTKTEIANNNSANVNETNQFLDKYNKNISDYAFKHKFLMDKTNNYLTRTETKNPYINKNVRLSDGKIGYVTAKGVYKWYPSQSIYDQTAGKNGCPSEIIDLNVSSNNKYNIPNETINADYYPLRVGTEMKMGQSCGNEGTNVFVSKPTKEENVSKKYEGCYRNPTTGLDFQSDMINNVTVDSCKSRAIDNGSGGFAVSTNGSSRKCYTVPDPTTVRSGGISTKTNTSYKLIQSSQSPGASPSNTGGLLFDGTIGIGNSSNFNTDPSSIKSLFAPNSLYSGCDANSGALINSSDTIASYGSNCTNKVPSPDKSNALATKPTQWQVVKNLTTPFNDEGGGNTIFLDRHNIDCGDNNGIKSFHLTRKGDGNFRYEYSCSAPFVDGNNITSTEVKGPMYKSTGFNDVGGGSSIFLDRHQLDCGEDGAITQFQLANNDTSKYQYNYKCIKMGTPMTSRMVTTPANDDGGGSALFLDRHDVVCADDEVMNYFTLYRPSDNQIAYKYRCSKFAQPSNVNLV
jgi:hypothetical protein